MYVLKRMAMRENRKRSRNSRLFSDKFVQLVNKYGRNSETALMAGYMLATNPFGAIGYAPIGLKLFTRGRLVLGKERIKGIDGLRRLIAKAQQLGGEV